MEYFPFLSVCTKFRMFRNLKLCCLKFRIFKKKKKEKRMIFEIYLKYAQIFALNFVLQFENINY